MSRQTCGLGGSVMSMAICDTHFKYVLLSENTGGRVQLSKLQSKLFTFLYGKYGKILYRTVLFPLYIITFYNHDMYSVQLNIGTMELYT